LLATRASALGFETDLGGSVRVPAAFCGLPAITPTTGRCDDLGRFSTPLGQRAIASQVGVMGRSVSDVALGLQVLNGGASPVQNGRLTPAMPRGDPQAIDITGLRVAWYDDDSTFTPAPAVCRAVREAVADLQARGASVQPWSPPDLTLARNLFYGALGADGYASRSAALGRDPRDRRIAAMEMAMKRMAFADLVLGLSGRGRLKREVVATYGHGDTQHYWRLLETLHDFRAGFLQSFAPFDVLMCPATALPALRHGATEELAVAGTYSSLFNVLG
jgi:fatty acid amide hydrolase